MANMSANTSSFPKNGARTAACPRFNFVLQAEFPLNALVLASDALRIANQNSGRNLFRWSFVSETGEAVRASNGMWFNVDHAIADMPTADICLLFEGNLPTQLNSQRLLGALRSAARYGAVVGAVDTGIFALVQAGLMDGESGGDIVLHWEAVPAFLERHPDTAPKNQIYLINQNTIHCAGGIATLDMMLDLIARYHGQALSNEVANALVHTRREAVTEQRSDGLFDSEQNSLTARIVLLMEKNLDFPLDLKTLSAKLRIPPRTLSRLCKHSFGESPMRLYLRIRLQAARNLLFYEESSIKDVAIACGFSYPPVFSRAFKNQFGMTPRAFRAAFRESQNQTLRPEIRRLIAVHSAQS